MCDRGRAPEAGSRWEGGAGCRWGGEACSACDSSRVRLYSANARRSRELGSASQHGNNAATGRAPLLLAHCPASFWMLALHCQLLATRLAAASRRTTARQLPGRLSSGPKWRLTSSSAIKLPRAASAAMAAAANGGGAAAPAPAGPASEYEPYLEVAMAAAREAGTVIAEAWNAPKKIDTKSGALPGSGWRAFLSRLFSGGCVPHHLPCARLPAAWPCQQNMCCAFYCNLCIIF